MNQKANPGNTTIDMSDELAVRIRSLVARELTCDMSVIGMETRLMADLGADSLAVTQIILDIEDMMDVDLDEHDGGEDVSLREILARIPARKDRFRISPDMPDDVLIRHMGEMSTSEIGAARAAIRWANAVADRGTAPDDAVLTRRGGRRAG